MKRSAVVLYGPPASGKDAVTTALGELDRNYVLFRRLKVGRPTNNGYRPTTSAELQRLRDRGLILYENQRYGNLYVVDSLSLDELLDVELIPVVHVGQIEGLRALRRHPAKWFSVLLWCSRHVTDQRVRGRGSTDVAARLIAWDETVEDLRQGHPGDFSLRIDTEMETPVEVAERIHAGLRRHRGER